MSNARRTNIETVDDGNPLLLTRRAVLAGGSVVALGGLAGFTALDGLMDRAGEQVVGTTASASAAFYAGRVSSLGSADSASDDGSSDGTQVFRTVPADVRRVPATVQADSRSIELEGWSTSGVTKAQSYNSSRSNKPRSEWWAGPDDTDDDSDDDGLPLEEIQDVELALLGHIMAAQAAVERRDEAAARGALDAFINATTKALRPALDRCGTGVCETIRENSEVREQGVRRATDAVDEGDWTVAVKELAGVEEIVLGDIERLDDELVDRDPERPRFSDLIEYLRGEPTIGERFTVCLPDAKLPGDRGSLAEELTPDRVLAYFAASDEPDAKRPPFHDRYGSNGIRYNDQGCVRLDGPASLHQDMACQTLLSAELDTHRTGNREIVGYGTEGGAVVSAAPASSDTQGKRVFLATNDVTGEIILGEDRDMVMPGDNVLNTQTLVCPVAVTPADCPCPLPGIFYVRRVIHDDQLIFAGGWLLDEGALYEDSATLLFDEGPTEVASVTPEDIESDDSDDRIVAQFTRDRSQQGSAVGSAQVQGTDMNKAELIESMASQAFQTDEGRKGLNAVNVKVIGEQGDDSDGGPSHVSATALDAPLVHLAGAGKLSDQQKRDLIVPVAMDKGLLR